MLLLLLLLLFRVFFFFASGVQRERERAPSGVAFFPPLFPAAAFLTCFIDFVVVEAATHT